MEPFNVFIENINDSTKKLLEQFEVNVFNATDQIIRINLSSDSYYVRLRNGTQRWYKNNVIHRDGDLPATIYSLYKNNEHGQEWYQHGNLHRDNDLPAIIRMKPDGTIVSQSWYKNDEEYIPNKPIIEEKKSDISNEIAKVTQMLQDVVITLSEMKKRNDKN